MWLNEPAGAERKKKKGGGQQNAGAGFWNWPLSPRDLGDKGVLIGMRFGTKCIVQKEHRTRSRQAQQNFTCTSWGKSVQVKAVQGPLSTSKRCITYIRIDRLHTASLHRPPPPTHRYIRGRTPMAQKPNGLFFFCCCFLRHLVGRWVFFFPQRLITRYHPMSTRLPPRTTKLSYGILVAPLQSCHAKWRVT